MAKRIVKKAAKRTGSKKLAGKRKGKVGRPKSR